MQDKFRIQADQYSFPYHYLVDLQAQRFGRHLDWGLDYYTYMGKVLALVKRYLTTDVLDVGCGDGFLLYNLAQDPKVPPGVRALGVDLDEKAIKFAQAFAHGLPSVSFEARDIAAMEEAYGLITVVETFEHVPDEALPSFTGHIDRLLRPGGHLIISVPSKVMRVIPKHYRHYDLDMLLAYFPSYAMREVHYMTARRSLFYQALALLLNRPYRHLNVDVFKRALLALHRRFTAEVSANRGAHIVLVLQKP